VLFQSRGRPDTLLPSALPAPEPRHLPDAGVLFCSAARDRCALVVLAEFLGVAAREILAGPPRLESIPPIAGRRLVPPMNGNNG